MATFRTTGADRKAYEKLKTRAQIDKINRSSGFFVEFDDKRINDLMIVLIYAVYYGNILQ
jgi:hypothetical protein